MNRNTENHFATIPEAEIGRSKFDRSKTMKTTFNTGDLIPIYVDQTIMPGDTVKMNMGSLIRMITPIAPVIDNIWMDTYFFFVPHRLTFFRFKNFMGENDSPWKQQTEYTIPKLRLKSSTDKDTSHKVEAGSLLNYMGIPIGLGQPSTANNENCIEISQMPIRAYIKIWNDWFRDQNTESELYLDTGTTTLDFQSKSYAMTTDDPYTNHVFRGATCAKANRIHDYFSSALPEPQKGPATLVPLVGSAPVIYGQGMTTTEDDFTDKAWTGKTTLAENISSSNGTGEWDFIYDENPYIFNKIGASTYTKLEVDMNNAVGATVNAIRQAFAIQKFYERQARGGWACALASS